MEYDDYYGYEEAEAPPEDEKVTEAGEEIMRWFHERPEETFYARQLEVIFEGRFFHWVTGRALNQLVATQQLASDLVALVGNVQIRFFRLPRHRYWKRDANEIVALVREFSEPEFTKALGDHGEMMFDAALASFGFLPTNREVREHSGKSWTATGHDLDRVFIRDGVAYGAEIKNTLPYIPGDEFRIKLTMCSALGLRPLFLVRMAPKSYVEETRQAGGFTLIVKYQLYPFGAGGLAKRVRERLGLPVDTPKRLEDGTTQRFLKWHLAHLGGAAVVNPQADSQGGLASR